jgi:dTDP-4-amino-4,6-dideoxygalactose transaminase
MCLQGRAIACALRMRYCAAQVQDIEEVQVPQVLATMVNLSKPEGISKFRVRYLVPDLPPADEILPYLREIDQSRCDSDFGPLEVAFRDEVARFFPGLSSDHIVTASSGALAIETALSAYGFPQGSRVLMPSYTFVATAAAVVRAGSVPIFADVDLETLALDPERAGHLAQTLGCSAVLPVGVAGMALATEPWEHFSEETGIAVIVDAAAGLGNQSISAHLTLAFSLHATKPFGIGEGGLVVSQREDVIHRARLATNFGVDEEKGFLCGTNARMSELQAAVGLAQLHRIVAMEMRRNRILATYRRVLSELSEIKLLMPVEKNPSNLIVMLPQPRVRELEGKLADAGIETRRLYVPPVHRHPAYLGYQCAEPMVNGESLSTHSLSLPCHGSMTEADVEEIGSILAHVAF